MLLVTYSPVWAEDSTNASGSTMTKPREAGLTRAVERQENLKERMEERKDRIEDRAASRAAKLDERKQSIVNRILAHARKMLERAGWIMTRLDNIWKRVESRMDKLKAAGKDLSSLTNLVTDVKSKREQAQNSIASASTSLSALEGSNEPKTAVEAFRQAFSNVKTTLKNYHQAIVAVIRSLQGMSQEIKLSTPSATTSTTRPSTQ